MMSKVRMISRIELLTLILLWPIPLSPVRAEELAKPPVAKAVPKTLTIHGHERADNYQWLRERENPDVIKYLNDENAYTDAMMKHTELLLY